MARKPNLATGATRGARLPAPGLGVSLEAPFPCDRLRLPRGCAGSRITGGQKHGKRHESVLS
jgi:hypothetical protein